MQFSDFTLIYKPMLISTLKECISNICDITEENHPQWRKTIKKHLLPYILAGKMNRGLLCVYSYKHIYNATLSLQKEKDIYVLAAILELLQSFLLIHDDIMDKDIITKRNGQHAYSSCGTASTFIFFSYYNAQTWRSTCNMPR